MTKRASVTGFTIVELLIVIVVIGILAAITIVAFNGVQARAHNAKRVSDLAGIAKAIELYRADNGRYPAAVGPGAPSGCLSAPGWNCFGVSGTNTRFLPEQYYPGQLPQDPQFHDSSACDIPNNSMTRAYWYGVNTEGTGFILGTYIPGLSSSNPNYVTQAYRECGSFVNYIVRGGVVI